MEGYTICEWLVILGAYAYEVVDSPMMTDDTFDRRVRSLAERGTDIPGFDPSTGQWVLELDVDFIGKIYRTAAAYNPKFKDIHHPQVIKALEHHQVWYYCCNKGVCLQGNI